MKFQLAAPRGRHPACHPIQVPESDLFYSKIDVTCLNYVRSALAVNPECKFGPAEQLNQASNHLDLSQLYGITSDEQIKIRRFIDGKLRSDQNPFEQLTSSFGGDHCLSEFCFVSGDPRVNSNPYSYALHNIFLRLHNKVAHKLAAENPTWSDEEIFKMARKTTVHVYQTIIYEEWAPVVLGREKAAEILSDVNDQAGPKMVSNEFATVGIRFYNTMFPGDLVTNQPQLDSNLLNGVVQME